MLSSIQFNNLIQREHLDVIKKYRIEFEKLRVLRANKLLIFNGFDNFVGTQKAIDKERARLEKIYQDRSSAHWLKFNERSRELSVKFKNEIYIKFFTESMTFKQFEYLYKNAWTNNLEETLNNCLNLQKIITGFNSIEMITIDE